MRNQSTVSVLFKLVSTLNSNICPLKHTSWRAWRRRRCPVHATALAPPELRNNECFHFLAIWKQASWWARRRPRCLQCAKTPNPKIQTPNPK